MVEHKFTNRLANETSPYLLQHAHNPVDWFAWSDEAFQKAKAEDKPILLSIGYSSCHWCHVMEKESFESEETARLMNENFINIKVDKEERPDVDQIYMNFVQLTTGHGGHPLTAFLTPEGAPFYAGTYFPPVDRYGMPSFQRVLLSVADAYHTRRDEILQSATEIVEQLRLVGLTEASNLSLSTEQLDTAFRGITRNYDTKNGGFGGAPKFPPPMTLEFCLRHWHRTKDEKALEIVTHTCRKMAEGGIYDQLGGGFHRYTVDAIWLVPHFEKMLYDNAQLVRIYLQAFQATKEVFFKNIAIETLEYIRREMTDETGGFYSATDADSEGEEGKFFIWTPEEIIRILGEEDARIFNFYYDVSKTGNFEGHSILHVWQSREESAQELGIPLERLNEVLERGKKLLFVEREKRVKPFRDEKILTAWNGLMLAAFAEASAVFEREDFRAVAEKNADFVLNNLRTADGVLLRTYKDGQAKLNGYLEDYAFYVAGLIELFQATGNTRWLQEAKSLTDLMIEEFWDEQEGGFYFTGRTHEELIVRSKDYFDNAIPSGNSVAAEVLLKLTVLTGEENYTGYAATIFRLVSSSIRRYPSAFSRSLGALDFFLNAPKEIVIIGEREAEDTRLLLREVWTRFMPNKVVVTAEESETANSEMIPLLQERRKINGKATAYVCENFSCKQPVYEPSELARQLED
ncbi:MAG: thioredoxin domain-containing protein [Acidobacteriota bacterium]|nr:thioredoxin domain-containing protein [Acidobacteriota bacterium]